MSKLKGYKTLVVAGVGFLLALAAGFGVVIPESEQAAVQAGLVSFLMALLRFATDSKVGG